MDIDHVENTKKAVPTTTEETATVPNQGTETNNKNNLENRQDIKIKCNEILGFIQCTLNACYKKELDELEAVYIISKRFTMFDNTDLLYALVKNLGIFKDIT